MALMTPKLAARELGVSVEELRTLDLPYVNVGAKSRIARRYDPDDIRNLKLRLNPQPRPSTMVLTVHTREHDGEHKLYSAVPVPERCDDRTYTYFIQVGRFVKIGRAKCVKSRMRAMQTGIPYDLRLVHYELGTNQIERDFQKRFVDQHHRYEWFVIEGRLRTFLDEKETMWKADPCGQPVDGQRK